MSVCGRKHYCLLGFQTRHSVVGLIVVFFLRGGFAKDPRSLSAASYLQRGGEYYAQGDLDHAIVDYNIAITFDPNYAKAYNCRGLALWTRGEVDRAIEDYALAIRNDPGLAEAFDNRGLAFQSKKDWGRAIQDHGRALQLKPRWALPHFHRGEVSAGMEMQPGRCGTTIARFT